MKTRVYIRTSRRSSHTKDGSIPPHRSTGCTCKKKKPVDPFQKWVTEFQRNTTQFIARTSAKRVPFAEVVRLYKRGEAVMNALRTHALRATQNLRA